MGDWALEYGCKVIALRQDFKTMFDLLEQNIRDAKVPHTFPPISFDQISARKQLKRAEDPYACAILFYRISKLLDVHWTQLEHMRGGLVSLNIHVPPDMMRRWLTFYLHQKDDVSVWGKDYLGLVKKLLMHVPSEELDSVSKSNLLRFVARSRWG